MNVIALSNLQQFAAVNVLRDPGYVNGPKIIPNCAMVRINWTLTDGKVAHNVLYAAYTGTPALSVAMANSVHTAITTGANSTAMLAWIAPTASITGVTLLDVRSSTGLEILSTNPAVPGTAAGAAMPDEMAVTVTLRTALRGQSGRGRFFVPGLASASTAAGGVIAASVVSAIQTWADAVVRSAITTNVGAMSLGLPHRQAYTSAITGRVFPDRPATTVPVTACVVKDNHWDSQRRRGLR